MKLFKFVFLVSIIFVNCANAQLSGTIRFISDFETGKIQDRLNPHDGWFEQHVDQPHTLNIVKEGELESPKPRSGIYSARLELRSGENPLSGSYDPRVQLRQHANPLSASKGYYIGFSVFIPSTWNPGDSIHITQIFSESKSPSGGNWGPLHKLVIDTSGNWSIRAAYASDPNSPPTTPISSGGLGRRNTHPVNKGKWTDFVYYINFSLTNGASKVWMDGVQIVDYTGPLGAPDGPFDFILDIYGAVERPTHLWFDQIKIAKSKEEVDPVSTNPPLAPDGVEASLLKGS